MTGRVTRLAGSFAVSVVVCLALPVAARAQQAMRVIGFMGGSTASSQGQWAAAFAQRLRELGWVEGRNVAIEYRWAEGRSERVAEIVAEFVRLKVDVIATSGTPQVIAAMQASSRYPNCLRSGGRPGWQRPRREPRATGRQCHRPLGPVN